MVWVFYGSVIAGIVLFCVGYYWGRNRTYHQLHQDFLLLKTLTEEKNKKTDKTDQVKLTDESNESNLILYVIFFPEDQTELQNQAQVEIKELYRMFNL